MAQAVTLKATALFVLMHGGIVNGYQLLCDAHTILEPHRGTAAFFSILLAIVLLTFLFMCLSLLTVLFLFLGASIVCVYNIDDSRLSCNSPTGHLSVETLGTTALK